MPRQIHSLVQNAQYLDHLARGDAVDEEMRRAASVAGDMERSHFRAKVFASMVTERIGTSGESGDGFEQRGLVDGGLPLAKRVSRVFQNAGEILFRDGAKADAPGPHRHGSSAPEMILFP